MKKQNLITPERERIGRIFKEHIEKAIDELGPGYTVDLQGHFDATPIRITVDISSSTWKKGEENNVGICI
jgi:hypothetical protein